MPLQYYGIILPESKPSSLSSLFFLTINELNLILKYYSLIQYKDEQLVIIYHQIIYCNSYCWARLLNDNLIEYSYIDKYVFGILELFFKSNQCTVHKSKYKQIKQNK